METFKRCLRFLDEASPLRRAIVVPMIQILHHLVYFICSLQALYLSQKDLLFFHNVRDDNRQT
jgi:hypothetical protein